MATHSSILAWRIPRTEKPGRLQSTGSERVRHDGSEAFFILSLKPNQREPVLPNYSQVKTGVPEP